MEGNLTRSVSGLSEADLNVTSNAVIQNYDTTDQTYDLSLSSVDDWVRVSIAGGAVEYEGNLSAPGAFEFHRRQITSVEDGLLAWYRFDEVDRTTIFDSSGRMRNGKILSPDATKPGEGNLSHSPNFYSSFDASKAFDDIDDEPEGRWLPKQSDLNTPSKVYIRYDFGEGKTISSYKIVSQHWLETERSPKAWVLQGSPDDTNWVTVDEENNQTGWGQWEPRTFEVDNPASFRFYKLTISEAGGSETYLGIAEIEFFTQVETQAGIFANAIDLNGEHIELPFKIDQGSETNGFSFASWIFPREIQGGIDDEKVIFSTGDDGWNWSGSIRNGVASIWSGYKAESSSLKLQTNQWAHTVFTFDPVSEKITVYLNSIPVTFSTLGFETNSGFLKIGNSQENRNFNGLIDDTRIWGRPLAYHEVLRLWGNGMGDLGPKAKIEVQSPVWSGEVNGTLTFNQQVSGFDSSTDLELDGFSLDSINADSESNNTIYHFSLSPDLFSQSLLNVKLKGNSVSDFQGMLNDEVARSVDFRPHRVRESDILLWWQLENNLSDSSNFENHGSGTPSFSSDGNLENLLYLMVSQILSTSVPMQLYPTTQT
jgi:hypothetical protein